MLDELRWYAARAMSAGANRIMRQTGWSLVDDSDIGFGAGALIKAGAGGVEMVLKNHASGLLFTLNSGYAELGVGYGADLKGGKALDIVTGLSTDGGIMPGGGIGEFMFGPYARKSRVDTPDWCNAFLVYAHLSGTVGMASGDAGIMFLLDLASTASEAWEMLAAAGTTDAFLRQVLCWQFCRGVGFGLGLEAGAMVRVLLTGELTLTQKSALASANWRAGPPDDPYQPRYPGQY